MISQCIKKGKKKERTNKNMNIKDSPGGPVVKTPCSQYRDQIPVPVRELDPTYHNWDPEQPNKELN